MPIRRGCRRQVGRGDCASARAPIIFRICSPGIDALNAQRFRFGLVGHHRHPALADLRGTATSNAALFRSTSLLR
jgi:hypothetical protein